MRSPTRFTILSTAAVLGLSLTSIVGQAPTAAADPDGGFTGIEARAKICDSTSPTYYSPYLNGDAKPSIMPDVGAGAADIQVTLTSGTSFDTQSEVDTALSGKVRVKIAKDTPASVINFALKSPTASPRTFYFLAEDYPFTEPLNVTQQVKLIGTRTNNAGVSASGNRTSFVGTSGNTRAIVVPDTATAPYVELAYLTIRDYGRSPLASLNGPRSADVAMVDATHGYGWYVHNNRFLRAEGNGLRAGSKSYVQDNCFEKNGRYGLSEYMAYDVQYVHNEIIGNGTAYPNVAEGSKPAETADVGDHGAMKLFGTRKVAMTKNWVHGNVGPGIWFDTNNSDVKIDQNWVEANAGQGIFYELSYNALITDNAVIGNNTTSKATYPGSRTQAGIFISNSGGGQLVGGSSVTAQTNELVTGAYANRLTINHNWVEDNKYGITLFQDAKRFCGSFNESSQKYCTLVGGRRVVSDPSSATKQIEFDNAASIGWTSPKDLTAPPASSSYVSCISLPSTSTPATLRSLCFRNTTNVDVTNNHLYVDPTQTLEAAISQQASTACPYLSSPGGVCQFKGQDPASVGTAVPLNSPFGSVPAFFRDQMSGLHGSAPDANTVTGTVLRTSGAAAAPANYAPCAASATVEPGGTGTNIFCASYY